MKIDKKFFIVFLFVMVASLAFGTCFADVSVKPFDTVNTTLSDKINNPISSILGILAVIAGAVAVGMLIFIGIKYVSKGAGAKAEVKDTLIPYLIGAILVGGASALAATALNMM